MYSHKLSIPCQLSARHAQACLQPQNSTEKGYQDLPATNYLLIAPLMVFFPFMTCFPRSPSQHVSLFLSALSSLWRTGQVEEERPFQHWLCPRGPGTAFSHRCLPGGWDTGCSQPGKTLTSAGRRGGGSAGLPRQAGSESPAAASAHGNTPASPQVPLSTFILPALKGRRAMVLGYWVCQSFSLWKQEEELALLFCSLLLSAVVS